MHENHADTGYPLDKIKAVIPLCYCVHLGQILNFPKVLPSKPNLCTSARTYKEEHQYL